MGVPTSEVGYTTAMPRREDHEVHKDMWGKKNSLYGSNPCLITQAISNKNELIFIILRQSIPVVFLFIN
jgi:hypothetical protein